MNEPIHMQLLTLANGSRVLRLEDTATGLSLERKLVPEKPVVVQKAMLLRLFQIMLQNEMAATSS